MCSLLELPRFCDSLWKRCLIQKVVRRRWKSIKCVFFALFVCHYYEKGKGSLWIYNIQSIAVDWNCFLFVHVEV